MDCRLKEKMETLGADLLEKKMHLLLGKWKVHIKNQNADCMQGMKEENHKGRNIGETKQTL